MVVEIAVERHNDAEAINGSLQLQRRMRDCERPSGRDLDSAASLLEFPVDLNTARVARDDTAKIEQILWMSGTAELGNKAG